MDTRAALVDAEGPLADQPFAFLCVCEALGFDPEAIRERVGSDVGGIAERMPYKRGHVSDGVGV